MTLLMAEWLRWAWAIGVFVLIPLVTLVLVVLMWRGQKKGFEKTVEAILSLHKGTFTMRQEPPSSPPNTSPDS